MFLILSDYRLVLGGFQLVRFFNTFSKQFHGQRSLVGYNSWRSKELVTTKQLMLLLFFFLQAIIELPEKAWHPTPVFLPGKSHGQRSLIGFNPWGREESDTTERLHFHFSLSCIREGNGNPLQCSCLENPRDGRAWGGCHLWGRTELDTTEAT